METEVGIARYGTTTPGIGGRIKAAVEDFVVEEIPKDLPAVADGRFLVTRVTVRNWETHRLVRQLARALGVSRHRIRFAGTKDKRAVTTQHMTFEGLDEEVVASVHLKDVTLEPLYRASRKLTLGDLMGNRFRIRLREVDFPEDEVRARLVSLNDELEAAGGFPNYFGIQRFGELRPLSHRLGRAIVRGDLARAVSLYVGETFPGEDAETVRVRAAFRESGDVARALKDFPTYLSFERSLLHHLRERPKDYEGALLRFPHTLLTLFVNAYQAYLFNRILSLRMAEGIPLNEPTPGDLLLPLDRRGLPDRRRPIRVTEANRSKTAIQVRAGKAWISGLLAGYDVPLAEGEMGRLESQIVMEEGVNLTDFRVRVLPKLSSRGLRRALVAPVREFAFRFEDDVRLAFTLNPGCYATSLLREVRKGDTI
ncbi:MAG: tRNA pseudouridine(13) synthase TruD [Candidatus Thermoplasmatota archaeon]|nr:tRNA pseudouridine(13) synthase TruD [Candidatus Thermoplasmatota archaeon]